MSQKQQSLLANCGLLLAAAIWGGGFLAGKYALEEYAPFAILAFRFLGAAVLVGILFFRTLRHSNPSVMQKGVLLGVLQFIGLSVQLVGLHHTTAGKQAFLLASYVMFVPFLARFFLKKRIQPKDIFAALLILIGVGCISLNEALTIGLGDALSIGYAFLFALQIIVVGAFSRKENPIQLSFFQFLSAGILASIFTYITDGVPTSCSPLTLYSLLYLTVLNTVVAFTIQNVAQRYTSETAASILISMESLFGFLFSALFLQETVTPKIILGCALIFGAALLSKLDVARLIDRQKTS